MLKLSSSLINNLRKKKKKISSKKENKKYFYEHLYKKYSNKKLVNLGSGLFNYPNWICVDINSKHYYPNGFPKNYIEINFMEDFKLPFEDNSIDIFYTSHCIEHIPDLSINKLFAEVYRSLKKEGLFRITCPNIDLAIEALTSNNRYFFDVSNQHKELNIFELYFQEWQDPQHRHFKNEKLLQDYILKGFNEIALNNLFEVKSYGELNGHINWLNETKITKFLVNNNFNQEKIFKRMPNQSNSELFFDNYIFERNYYNFSLFIETIK